MSHISNPATDHADILVALQSTSMLAALRTPSFGTKRRDKEAGARVSTEAGAVADAAKVTVNLLAGADELHKSITHLQRQARDTFNTLSMPWDGDTWRLLPSALFDRCTNEVMKFKRPITDLKEKLRHEAPTIIDRARDSLGDFAHRLKLPTPDEMVAAYDMVIEFQPIPDGARFHGLPEATLRTLRRHVEQRAARKSAEAMREPMERFAARISYMVERLRAFDEREQRAAAGEKTGREGTFRSALLADVQELAAQLAAFNVTNDPAFAEVCRRAAAFADTLDAEAIKASAPARAQATSLASDLLGAIAALHSGR